MSLHLRSITADGIGPLRSFRLEPAALTVVEGDNEAGKSSIVVALHRHLCTTLRRANLTSLPGMRRGVPGYDGEVTVELVRRDPRDPDRAEPVAEPPQQLCEIPLLWNLLVIPEGWAAGIEIGSGNWLEESSQHLTGFDPDPLRKSISDRAGLTPKGRDARDWVKRDAEIADGIAALESFLASLDELAGQEEALRAARGKLGELEAEARDERQAVDFDRYERGRAALDQLVAADAELPDHARYTDDDLITWRELDGKRDRATSALAEARRTADERQRELREAERGVARLRSDRQKAADLEDRVAGRGVHDRAVQLAYAIGAARETASKSRWLRPAGWILMAAGALGLLLGVLLGRWQVALVGIMFLAGLAMTVAAAHLSRRPRRLERDVDALLADGRKLSLEADDLEGLIKEAEKAERGTLHVQATLDHAAAEATRRERLLADDTERAGVFQDELDAIEEQIAQLRDRTGLPALAELEQRVEQRRRLEEQKRRAAGELSRLLPDTPRARWAETIERLAIDDPGRRPAPGRLEALERQLAAQRQRVGELDSAIRATLDRGLARVGQPDAGAARRTLERLREEQQDRARRREAAELALRAVEEAETDFVSRFEEALRDDRSGVNPLLARITGGRWAGVRRTGDGQLEAFASDGAAVPLAGLSRGTQDQLLFAVRAVLAERILGEPAFFVWDDTFLTADPQRRRSLVRTAVELAQRGWQVLYLTVDPTFTRLFEEAARDAGVDFRRAVLAEG